jgi:hypothetical protein
MIGDLDFAAGAAVLTSLIAVALVLAVVARLPAVRDRNALQFLVSGVIVMGLWLIALLLPGVPASTAADLATSLMILAGALLVYLEAWALLSRGYTLGLLLTLFRGKRAMTDAQLAASYRGGQGVGWIMRHRLGGDRIVLTSTGAIIAMLYRVAIAVLGLKVTG